jgi:3-oxoisoapionate decarboxylase
MKLGLHGYALLYACGLREYQPLGRGPLTADAVVEKAAAWDFSGVQLAEHTVASLDIVGLVNLRKRAEELGLVLHLSTSDLQRDTLARLVRAAYNLGAPVVSVSISRLKGTVKDRQSALEQVLDELQSALRVAQRNKIVIALENGKHCAAADLVALLKALDSERVVACFDTGNPLTVPESPLQAAKTLAPYVQMIHLKDFRVYRTEDGLALMNCVAGEGAVPLVDTLSVLHAGRPDALVFLQTTAERVPVPLLNDAFLKDYPRITPRALAEALRGGVSRYEPDDLLLKHETTTNEKAILAWEEERLLQSRTQAEKLMGMETLPLEL